MSTDRGADGLRLETLAVHSGGEPDLATGAIAPPIHLSTTFRHGPAGGGPWRTGDHRQG